MQDLPIDIALSGLVGLLVSSVIGVLKKQLPGLRGWLTVSLSGVLCFFIAGGYTFFYKGDCSPKGIYIGAINGVAAFIAAWGGAAAIRWKQKET